MTDTGPDSHEPTDWLVFFAFLAIVCVLSACTSPSTLGTIGTMNRGRGVCDVTGGLIADGCPIVLMRKQERWP